MSIERTETPAHQSAHASLALNPLLCRGLFRFVRVFSVCLHGSPLVLRGRNSTSYDFCIGRTQRRRRGSRCEVSSTATRNACWIVRFTRGTGTCVALRVGCCSALKTRSRAEMRSPTVCHFTETCSLSYSEAIGEQSVNTFSLTRPILQCHKSATSCI